MFDAVSRRDFLHKAALAGTALAAGGLASRHQARAQEQQPSEAPSRSPNEKLHVACIGTANRGGSNIHGVRGENMVALCDIDDKYLARAAEQFPKAKKYNDFRKMLEQYDIDAVVVSTPDHTHAPASVAAMQLGKHVYCEKPLTHSVYEARVCAETAARMNVATQMGTQIHASDNYRRVVEVIQSGAIGPVHEVHVWVGKGWGGGERPQNTPPVPPHIHWDLWLGPAPQRPYHPKYLPENWRRWWDFGGGTLGDMACHYMDLPFWALKLRHPTSVAAEGTPVHSETCPLGLRVHYEFPARDRMPAVKFTWSDGNLVPQEVAGHKVRGSGVMFVGEQGQMFADYGSYKLYPESDFVDYQPPEPSIPDSIGHHQEWILACKSGSPTTCNFDYSGALTEAVLLGNVAFRVGKKLEWDAENLRANGAPEADPYIRREYRQSWTL